MGKPIRLALVPMFWRKTQKGADNECWPWLSYKNENGYGYISYQQSTTIAPRIAAFIKYGQPPSDKHQALHSCDNPACVNPNHLSWGIQSRNMLEARQRGLVTSTKLTELKVSYIKRLLEAGYTMKKISGWYSVHPKVIYDIRKGVSWYDVAPYAWGGE